MGAHLALAQQAAPLQWRLFLPPAGATGDPEK